MDQLLTSSQTRVDRPSEELPGAIAAALAPCDQAAAAQAFTWRLAHTHYENFPVVSILLPASLRQDFCNIYAFCRIADDLGDELADREMSLRLLDDFRRRTEAMYNGRTDSVLFAALHVTVARHDIPVEPFLNLIDAFEQDQRVSRYDTFEQLREYCRRSADPVGRLVLYVGGYRDPQRQEFSDFTCTALQLTNFWQDVRRDVEERDRIYLPRETMEQFNVTESQIVEGHCTDDFRRAIEFEVDRAAARFDRGDALLPLLSETLRPQVALFGRGGRAILKAIRRQNYDTLTTRPTLSRWQLGQLILRAMAARLTQVSQEKWE